MLTFCQGAYFSGGFEAGMVIMLLLLLRHSGFYPWGNRTVPCMFQVAITNTYLCRSGQVPSYSLGLQNSTSSVLPSRLSFLYIPFFAYAFYFFQILVRKLQQFSGALGLRSSQISFPYWILLRTFGYVVINWWCISSLFPVTNTDLTCASLQMASHNTQGLNSPVKRCKAFQHYPCLGLDVLLLQETSFSKQFSSSFIHHKFQTF